MTINSFSVRVTRNLHKLARTLLMRRLLAAQDKAERAVDSAVERTVIAASIVVAAQRAKSEADTAAEDAAKHCATVEQAIDAELEALGY